MCGSTLNCQTLCLGAYLRYSLVVDEDVKKPTKQTNISMELYSKLLSVIFTLTDLALELLAKHLDRLFINVLAVELDLGLHLAYITM